MPESSKPDLRLVQGVATLPRLQARPDLPLQPKAIIGRDRDLDVARQCLARPEVRLLTLTGPPGVGKTRLALALAAQVADEFEAGALFVDLAPITDADLVGDAIARALDLRELDYRRAPDVLVEFLRDTSVLLILDNFEHVLDAAELVGRLLGACPDVKVVATSRAPLHLRWEYELPVAPLELPAVNGPGVAGVLASPAGRLFVERARAVAPGFVLGEADAAAVAEICAVADGLPLAIELAAARVKLLPPRALLRRLQQPVDPQGRSAPLHLLADQTRDTPPRQQTLLRAITWSYELLEEREQTLLRRLSAFVGGCSVEAAQTVGAFDMAEGLDVLTSLIDKSLVWRDEQPDGEPRVRMLETIRQFAVTELTASGEVDAARARHAAYYVELAELAALEFSGVHQQAWFDRLESERANLRASERWAVAHRERQAIVRLTAALWPFWLAREDASYTREPLDAIIAVVDAVPADPLLARALHGAGLLAEKSGDYVTCRALLTQSVSLARQVQDRPTLAAALDSSGRQAFIEGRYAEARQLLEESHAILRELEDSVGLARVLSHLGFLELLEGRPATARAIFDRGLALALAAQDQHRVAEFMDNLGNTSEHEGQLEDAARKFEEAIAIWRRLGQGHWLAMALNNLGNIQVQRGELESARIHLLEALTLARRLGNRRRMAYALAAVGALAAAEGDADRAASVQAIAAAAAAEIGAAGPPRAGYRPSASGTQAPTLTLDQAVDESLARLTREPRERDVLTRRERDVVALLARGLTNRQIAEALVVTEGTAENYVQRIRDKLGLSNRAQIAVWAAQRGVGSLPTPT